LLFAGFYNVAGTDNIGLMKPLIRTPHASGFCRHMKHKIPFLTGPFDGDRINDIPLNLFYTERIKFRILFPTQRSDIWCMLQKAFDKRFAKKPAATRHENAGVY
jgi:hypothetical protein